MSYFIVQSAYHIQTTYLLYLVFDFYLCYNISSLRIEHYFWHFPISDDKHDIKYIEDI